jgi:phosphopantothenoylcysteine decarboxylase/phosphopantothenate--cysteine ligase
LRRGAAVTLVTGPTHLPPPHGANVVKVRSAADMHAAVMERTTARTRSSCRPPCRLHAGGAGAEKVKKATARDDHAQRTKDILGELGKLPSREQGCRCSSASRRRPTTSSRTRRQAAGEGADLIVANDVSRADAGFDVDTNAVTLVGVGREDIPLQSKSGRRGAHPRSHRAVPDRRSAKNAR